MVIMFLHDSIHQQNYYNNILGEPLGIEYGTSSGSSSSSNDQDKEAEMIQKKETMKRLLSSNKDDVKKIEKMLGLSEKEILEECSKNMDDTDTALFSIGQTLNLIVYMTILITFIVFVNKEYDNAATAWFVHYFPREAATLHLYQQQ